MSSGKTAPNPSGNTESDPIFTAVLQHKEIIIPITASSAIQCRKPDSDTQVRFRKVSGHHKNIHTNKDRLRQLHWTLDILHLQSSHPHTYTNKTLRKMPPLHQPTVQTGLLAADGMSPTATSSALWAEHCQSSFQSRFTAWGYKQLIEDGTTSIPQIGKQRFTCLSQCNLWQHFMDKNSN